MDQKKRKAKKTETSFLAVEGTKNSKNLEKKSILFCGLKNKLYLRRN